jgi:cytosine/creatinine deaminase
VQSLTAEYRWAIDIEICVFPQDGLTNYPGTDELLVEALKRGARAVGGAPRYDTDHAGQIRRIFELAREFDVDVDIHLDVGDTPEGMDIHLVCERTARYTTATGYRVRGTVGPQSELAMRAAGPSSWANQPIDLRACQEISESTFERVRYRFTTVF